MQWFAVILTGIATFTYIVLKIYKKYKNKNSACAGCLYSGKCAIKQIKNNSQIRKKQK
jgi:hypothetical protein